nr:deoxyribodipyrimidine photo-lyase [Actinomycetota bacterium]
MLDEAILASRYASPNRTGFLLESLTDLRHSLRGRGADLVVRRVDPVRETMALVDQSGANTVFASADVSAFAQRRERRLTAACRSAGVAHRGFPGVSVVAPEALSTASGSLPGVHALLASAPEAVLPVMRLPEGLDPGELPALGELVAGAHSPEVVRGGESEARRRLNAWSRSSLGGYEAAHDDLASATSRAS